SGSSSALADVGQAFGKCGVAGIGGKSLAIGFGRFSAAAELFERSPEQAEAVRVAALDFERLLCRLERFLRSIQSQVRARDVAVRHAGVRLGSGAGQVDAQRILASSHLGV